MRTTVTLDPDVEQLLREARHRTRSTFKETINNAIREGLKGFAPQERESRFEVAARPMGLRTGIDPARLADLGDEMEVDAFLSNAQALLENERSATHPRS